MKKDTKIIIVLAVIVICLLGFISYYFSAEFKNLKSSNETQEKSTETSSSTSESNQEKEDYNNLGKEIQVKVSDDTTLPFYILSEDETTYTLLLKESLGKTTYYSADDCNSSNESGCENKKSDDNISVFLKEKTSSWNNVGEVKIPQVEDYNKIKSLNTDNSFLDEYSCWLLDNEKNNIEKSYYNKDEKNISKDKIYNEQELRPIIKILKIFAEK